MIESEKKVISEMKKLFDIDFTVIDSTKYPLADLIYFPDFSYLVKDNHIIRLCIRGLYNRTQIGKENEIPDIIGELSFLEQLVLANNDLIILPLSLGRLKKLKFLNLSGNFYLDTLPDTIGNLESLVSLNLSGTFLKTLPESISKLKTLEYLNLKKCFIEQLPETLGELTSLKKLVIGCNNLKSLPKSLGGLKSLETLEITTRTDRYGSVKLSKHTLDLPESFGKLHALKSLTLEGCKTDKLPESFGKLQSLINVYIGHCNLSELPSLIGNLKSLVNLSLNSNNLRTLPNSIGKLTSLKNLNLTGNQLQNLPQSIGNLFSLKDFKLPINCLKTLPKSIGNLSSLTCMDLAGNEITQLPESIGNLSSLTHLYMEDNKLTDLPQSIINLKSLRYFGLKGNKVYLLTNSLPEPLRTFLKKVRLRPDYNPDDNEYYEEEYFEEYLIENENNNRKLTLNNFENFIEDLKYIDEIDDEFDKLETFINILLAMKDTELINTQYPLIASKLPDVLKAIDSLEYEFKFDYISTLINSIKDTKLITTHLITSKFTDFFNSVDSTEDSINTFSELIKSIKDTELINTLYSLIISKLPDVLKAIDSIEDDWKFYYFSDLIKLIKNTELMNTNLISSKFKDYFSSIDSIEENDKKLTAFSKVFNSIKDTKLINTPLINSKFTDFFNSIDSTEDSIVFFSELINSIKETELIKDQYFLILSKLPLVLKTILSIEDDRKFYYFSSLIKSIKNTELMNTNLISSKFPDVLNGVDSVEEDRQKLHVFSELINSIKDTELVDMYYSLIRTKFLLILNALEKIVDTYTVYNLIISIPSKLLADSFLNILRILDKIKNYPKKKADFSILFYWIKDKKVLEDNFTDILNILDKKHTFVDLVPSIKARGSIKAKVNLVKEYFVNHYSMIQGPSF